MQFLNPYLHFFHIAYIAISVICIRISYWFRLKPNFIRKSRERQEPTPRARDATEGGPDTFYSDIEEGNGPDT